MTIERRQPAVNARLYALVLLAVLAAAVPVPAMAETLVQLGATWKYLDNGSDQGTAWRGPTFSDGAWASGPAQLGYGDGDEATVVGFGPNASAKYITTYFRRTFTVASASSYTSLGLRLLRDDGAVVYLNGTEVFRSNMPSGAVSGTTPASVAVGGADESAFFSTSVSPALLFDGANVLAVEIHQSSGSSSDISFDLELTGSQASAQVRRGPYLQQGTPTSIVVRWRTDVPTASRVRFGASPTSLTQVSDVATVTTEHEVALQGLSPATKYFYSVGSPTETHAGGDAEHVFTTAPTTGVAAPTRVWVLGDSGTADANAGAVRNAYQGFAANAPPDLWLMLGDNAYNDGTDAQYQAAVFDMYPAQLRKSVLWPTLGNHDAISADSGTQSGPYYDIFTLPTAGEAGGVPSGTEAYYSFDHGNIHFVCLDSQESDRSPTGAMMQWLDQDLAATDATWLVAFWHHPPYSKGSHDSDTETQLIEMRERALPILESYGVDLVLTGHSHSYERSFLLDGHYATSSTLTPGMILDGGDGRPGGDGAYLKPAGAASHQGAVYVVAGSSGKTTAAPLNHPVMYLSLLELGSVVLDVDGNTLNATFLNSAGAIDDSFTIVKATAEVCGNGVREGAEQCDGTDLGAATCLDVGCASGAPLCTPACALDYAPCGGCQICDNNGACEPGEDCTSCPNDCPAGSGAACGNGVCETGNGESCLTCPTDCRGKQDGKPSRRFCCGGGGSNPVTCGDPRCTSSGFQCTNAPTQPSCCGDGSCTGIETGFTCALDCGAPPRCGDGACWDSETSCACPQDCGSPPTHENVSANCNDGIDNDCDGATDCGDADCGTDPTCVPTCQPAGAPCAVTADCCRGACKGKKGNRTCQ